jgi:hypothetical protein
MQGEVVGGVVIMRFGETQAGSFAERSLKTWAQVKEPGVLSPDGFDCVAPSVVAQRLVNYKAALASEQSGDKH